MISASATGSGAHPRSRGENKQARATAMAQEGSSPLTRGKRRLSQFMAIRCRLIPAHAGKTDNHGCIRIGGRAHPRSRGENDLIRVAGYLSVGSSPLTRGKRYRMVRF